MSLGHQRSRAHWTATHMGEISTVGLDMPWLERHPYSKYRAVQAKKYLVLNTASNTPKQHGGINAQKVHIQSIACSDMSERSKWTLLPIFGTLKITGQKSDQFVTRDEQ